MPKRRVRWTRNKTLNLNLPLTKIHFKQWSVKFVKLLLYWTQGVRLSCLLCKMKSLIWSRWELMLSLTVNLWEMSKMWWFNNKNKFKEFNSRQCQFHSSRHRNNIVRDTLQIQDLPVHKAIFSSLNTATLICTAKPQIQADSIWTRELHLTITTLEVIHHIMALNRQQLHAKTILKNSCLIFASRAIVHLFVLSVLFMEIIKDIKCKHSKKHCHKSKNISTSCYIKWVLRSNNSKFKKTALNPKKEKFMMILVIWNISWHRILKNFVKKLMLKKEKWQWNWMISV